MSMQYPLIIHRDKAGYGVTVPDAPGCFTVGDTLDEALANVQEALQAYISDGDDINPPSSADDLIDQLDGGFLALLNIDLDAIRTRSIRVNITLPERLLGELDAGARALGTSRSGFIARAAEELLRREAKRSKRSPDGMK